MGSAARHAIRRWFSGLVLVLALSGCSIVLATPPKVTNRISNNFTPANLVYCYGHACANQQTLTLRPAQWDAVRTLFANAAAGAEEERQDIRVAIGMLERYAGALAGTDQDKGGTIPFGYASGPPQLDCYDEAINASNFLGLLQRDGLLRYHRVEAPVQRSFVNGDIIHATAVVREVSGDRFFAVDSSYFDNGEAASIAPLDDWLAGWAPPELAAAGG